MSFVCSVAFSQVEGSLLPTQCILLYETIVNSMVSWWCNQLSTIPIPELIRILSNIATYIHENSASGLMHEEKMKEICIQSIKDSLSNHFDSKEKMQEIENQTSEFVRTICEDVGILASRVSIKTISPLCHLIEGKPHDFDNIKWLTQLSCLILESMSTLDNENNEFAIDWLLVKITFSSHRLLSVNTFTLKGFLLENNEKSDAGYRIAVVLDRVPQYLLFCHDTDLLFSLIFIPSHLQNLYLRILEHGFIMIHPVDMNIDEREYLLFGHILLECLMLLSNPSCESISLQAALIALLRMLRMHYLENFGSIFVWALAVKSS
ncbi:unnamed protein product, partial [Rotaria sp. Silwood1]